MATRNVATQASRKKNTRSFSLRSCEASVTSSKRAHTMKTKSIAKVALSTAARQTVSPTSEFQDSKTQHKASSWVMKFKNLAINLQSARLKTIIVVTTLRPRQRGRACQRLKLNLPTLSSCQSWWQKLSTLKSSWQVWKLPWIDSLKRVQRRTPKSSARTTRLLN